MSDKVTAIYKITSPSGAVYIGQTRNLDNRINCYKWKAIRNQVHLYRSILAYGWIHHTIEVVQLCDNSISQSELNDAEHRWWLHFKSSGVEMLNLKEPGNQPKQSLETKIKIGLAHRGKHHNYHPSPEVIRRLRERMMGNKFRVGCKLSLHHKMAITKALKGKARPAEAIRNIRLSKMGCLNPMFGRKLTDEHKAKLSASVKARIITPEMRARMSMGGKLKELYVSSWSTSGH